MRWIMDGHERMNKLRHHGLCTPGLSERGSHLHNKGSVPCRPRALPWLIFSIAYRISLIRIHARIGNSLYTRACKLGAELGRGLIDNLFNVQ